MQICIPMELNKYTKNNTQLPKNNEVGGIQKKCNILLNIGQNIDIKLPDISDVMEDLRSKLITIKGPEVPIFLDPKTATLTDVGIHAHIRQHLDISTIEKHLRYLRFMELHACPVVFNNLTPEAFIRHMDYRLYTEISPATPNALNHEKKAVLMCLRAFKQYTDDWKQYVKTPPIISNDTNIFVPVPSVVNALYHAKYSSDEYENILLQTVVFNGFNIGARPPSEICNQNVDSLVVNGDNTAYLKIKEKKKHGKIRIYYPWDALILTSPVYRTALNYIKCHRSKVVNHKSIDNHGEALYLQPNGRRITPNYLRDHIAPIFKKLSGEQTAHLYTMRHTYATYLYDRTHDIKDVADYLGHSHLDNVNKYVHISKALRQQSKEKRRDLFHQALRQSHGSDGGQFDEENRYLQKNLTVSPNLSEKDKWACPNLNRRL